MGVLFLTFSTQAMASFSESLLYADAPGKHEATFIFLHGLGDTGDGWFDEIKKIQKENPTIRVVCPTAPIQPVTINGGMSMTSWHDLTSLTEISTQEFAGIDKTTEIGK